jgi:hypothetical protein
VNTFCGGVPRPNGVLAGRATEVKESENKVFFGAEGSFGADGSFRR